MDDLAQLQSRVEAARERLGGVEADQRKYGLRLDDLVRIVEGALSRQSGELQAARIRAASLETELDDARNTIARHEVDLAAKDTDLARLETQNEQLRSMVKTLLDLVEGRNATPLREAMIRLERGVRHLLIDGSSTVPRTTPVVSPPPRAETPKAEIPRAETPRIETAKPAPTVTPLDTPVITRPTLVPNQTVQGRIPNARPAASPFDEVRETADPGDALIELTAATRGDAERIVQEPPELPSSAAVMHLNRRLSDAADA